ncbi:hypothetical protein [Staphylococcus epidermidis]|uniref:hypothetical protein n=1 Tax=Staphylococcus epidermidis TaxID=1282 RepID=UPI0010FF4EC7|nr:hypothetical protein [Staphylococcus epidermidis]MBF2323512.1 hypothetical protein [Staphylococcus epidermidis]MBF2325680.1 hypothetical protein [Staphylococcus epidermidis]MBF2327883.1 hypothetical protein [Staphylococcus epidermidis]MBF2332323.1 hypothetical protein [Staphylococcus epidermidis]MCG1124937.1 hypothetical protein [Staphylococcus epidermidis]
MNFKKIGKWIFIFIILSILFYLLVFTSGKFIFNKFSNDGRESFIAAITFFSIFATFGGAYLGAKMSGDNTLKLAKKERLIDDLIKTSENNSEFLRKNKFLRLKKQLDTCFIDKKIKNGWDLNKYRRSLINLELNFNDLLKNTNLSNLSNIIAYEYRELLKSIENLNKFLSNAYSALYQNTMTLLEKKGHHDFKIIEFESQIFINENVVKDIEGEKISINIKNKIENKEEWVEVDLEKFNTQIDKKTLNKLNELINEVEKEWLNINFKEIDQLRKYIVEYLKE